MERFGYSALLSSKAIPNGASGVVLTEIQLRDLSDGDVVLIEKDGGIKRIWDCKSPHNSLLVTEQCNSRCIMCPQPPKKEVDSRHKFNLKVLELIGPKGVESLALTGGEPTLREEELINLISLCKKKLPNTSLMILTNGRKLRDFRFAKQIVEVGHQNLMFGVPLYASTDKEHDRIVGSKGAFYETLAGLKNLALFLQKIEIRIVLHKLTYKRLLALSDFIYRNLPFVAHISFMGMETHGLAEKNLERLWIDPVDYIQELSEAINYLYKRNLNVSIYNLPHCILPEGLWRFSRQSISDWKNIFIKECSGCDLVNECAGFFETSSNVISKHIKPIKLANYMLR
ncbi:His-Xaa-Ser system radical SAM maturase HxsC [Thermodesulfobacteriota bacterium]